jgi:hypothetical protein
VRPVHRVLGAAPWYCVPARMHVLWCSCMQGMAVPRFGSRNLRAPRIQAQFLTEMWVACSWLHSSRQRERESLRATSTTWTPPNLKPKPTPPSARLPPPQAPSPASISMTQIHRASPMCAPHRPNGLLSQGKQTSEGVSGTQKQMHHLTPPCGPHPCPPSTSGSLMLVSS